ncbi:SDR family NAD(P)-dependent oxidoreductase [Adhaeribacter sp. BT258]|uniref:SDR family NAD(P)-dependent oxidoreductase n=1 Tax=Adhaeribacter terrigena TaxID=2793070 RepID=A0ABS1BY04_9BACT|nr:SDR family NAD(P)-dependent oxidoreductase [Adhaeribacter terrigena]MBK0401987.1 SDR family NAD(P)-dependent oxidoreductase [Adhaeribacter terrigena]
MKYYIITGTGKGIGNALAEELLKEKDTSVIGISRHQTIVHPQYQHQNLDLSDTQNLIARLPEIFPDLKDAEELALVNNAGVLGEIGYVGEKQPEDFGYIFSVNITVPAILMNAFLEQYSALNVPKVVLNISSGAGKYPMDGWAGYCASKAALDLFSQTVQLEQDLRKTGVKVFSLAPGIVDTQMQSQIRSADEAQFSLLDKFQDYKSSGSLASPETVGKKLKKLLQNVPDDLKVVCRIDEIA